MKGEHMRTVAVIETALRGMTLSPSESRTLKDAIEARTRRDVTRDGPKTGTVPTPGLLSDGKGPATRETALTAVYEAIEANCRIHSPDGSALTGLAALVNALHFD